MEEYNGICDLYWVVRKELLPSSNQRINKGIFTTGSHPATNGKVERVNRVIKSLFRRFVNTGSWALTFGEEASNNEIDDEEFQ